MNYYIDKYQQLINDCHTKADYQKAYQRISSVMAGMVLGRGFNQSFEAYLDEHPVKREFNAWWHTVYNDLHIKAYDKPFKPAT